MSEWRGTNAELFAEVAKRVGPEQRTPAIVLVGARDHAALAVRYAQASLRFDRRASYWSHAALIVDWSKEPVGVEVDMFAATSRLLPERNGAQLFRLAKYADERRWPNVAIATLGAWKPETTGEQQVLTPDWRARVRDAATNPNRQRPRYRLFEWIAPWTAYVFDGDHAPNPVVTGTAHPGAALVEYAFSAAPLDVAPGGTSPSVCPEHLWATFLHWHGRLSAQAGELQVFAAIRDRTARPLATRELRLRKP